MLEAVLDYETRSACPLDKAGAIEYSRHESTSIFCLGYRINGGPAKLWIPERAPMPLDLWECFKRGILVAHNASFERAVTKWALTRYECLSDEQRDVLRALPPSRWRCLAAKAAMCSLPRSLDGAGAAMGLKVQKDGAGSRLIKKYSKPRKPSKNNPSPWWTAKKDLRAIYRYCLTDVNAEYELHQALPDLSEYEQKVWELDQKINDRGILIDVATVRTVLGLVREETGNITREVRRLSKGEIDSPMQQAKLLKWVNARGARMQNLQAPVIRDKLLEDDLHPGVREMLIYRQGGSKTSVAKYVSMLQAVGSDNRARELLLYAGATPTARWAGKRVQPQNFPRPTIKDFNSDEAISIIQKGGIDAIRKRYGKAYVMDVLVSAIRGMLIASPGCDFACGDFSAVEARGAFWVTEHEEGLEAFRQKRKLYEEMASEAFDIPIEMVTKESIERFVGKESVLGCQYGMGWKKFLSQCHKKGVKQVDAEMAKRAVYTYRKVHHPIPEFWKKIEDACVQAILNPGKRIRVTKVVVYMAGDWMCIKLPSGRRLRYYKPRVAQKQLASGRMVPEVRYYAMEHFVWKEVAGWGGVFLNHIVQGISRDLMVNGVFNIEEAGYRFLLSVHDEGLSEREKGRVNLKEYLGLMTRLPKWANGFPLEAEGWEGPRYRKG